DYYCISYVGSKVLF
nr:immunoglobulin light chain junction region [Macaca mulatta]MOW36299.1 immunoglobulin light chain junction region [Macaca mulatta]MOW36362.1 immunoglobulin light chain junction region [Macaca mulatta]MOW36913.1 immunoglobulin light chain junction region [Macaca mulatta]MOW37508.1 immunoglobulin light chain junction region [Macaca mulatta]